jgi:hypothetical protein
MVLELHRLSTIRRKGLNGPFYGSRVNHPQNDEMPTVRAAVRCAVCFGLRRKPVETFFANIQTSQPWMEVIADICSSPDRLFEPHRSSRPRRGT